jgi:hypothetical protein
VSYTSLAPPYRQNLHRYFFFGWQVEIVYFENRIMAITIGTVDSVRLLAGLARKVLQGRSLTARGYAPASVLLLKLTLRQSRVCLTRNFRIGTEQ